MSDCTANEVYAAPLIEGQIRLLALEQGKGDDPLQGRMHIADAASAQIPYEAISYVWGSEELADIIRCDSLDGDGGGSCLPLTRNAANALRAVRKADGVRMVWIDSVCISQACKAEKAAQVAIMDSIFANATTVLAWLGADDGVRSAAAAEIAILIQEQFSQKSDPKGGQGAMETIESRARQRCYDDLTSVLPLFECELFWRLWCVQELVLAKQSLIYWGSSILTWDTIAAVAAFVESEAQLHVAHFGVTGVNNVIMLESLRNQVTGKAHRRMPFSRILSLTRLHGVTEPCDRIYSLLGLDRWLSRTSKRSDVFGVHRWLGQHSGEVSKPLISPDYLQGINKVYLTTAKALLARERNLHILSFVQHEAEVGGGDLPSWVPRWHVNKQRLITQFDLIRGHPVYTFLETAWANSTANSFRTNDRSSASCDIPSGLSVCPQHTTGPDAHEKMTVDDEGTLHTEGLLLASVVKTSLSVPFETGPADQWLEVLRQWFQMVSAWLTREDQSGLAGIVAGQRENTVFSTFYRTLLGGHFRTKEIFARLQDELKAFRALLCSRLSDEANTCPVTRAYVSQMCRSRALFLTDSGQIGIGPQCLQTGDSVCFLAGAAVPLLLRPRSTPETVQRRWLLVGEAFVSGLADPYLEDDSAKAVEALQSVEDDEAERFTSSATDAEAQEPIPHWQPKNWGDFRVERDSGVQCNYYQGSGHQINQYQGSGTYHYNSTVVTFTRSSEPEITGNAAQTTQDTIGKRIQFCID
jgi:hypothetical protein